MAKTPSFTVGIEEEYMLVHPETGDLVCKVPRSLMPSMRRKLGKSVSPEFLQSQVEIGTPVCTTVQQARKELAYLRATVAEVAADQDMAIIAASTHPFADPMDHPPRSRCNHDSVSQSPFPTTKLEQLPFPQQ